MFDPLLNSSGYVAGGARQPGAQQEAQLGPPQQTQASHPAPPADEQPPGSGTGPASLPQAETERQAGPRKEHEQQQQSGKAAAVGMGRVPPGVRDGGGGGGDSPSYQSRVRMFERELSRPRVDLDALRRMAFFGIPEGLRALVWQLLLAYLPPERGRWEAVRAERREAYRGFCAELIVDPSRDPSREPPGGTGARRAGSSDHPLSQCSNSKWNAFFQDTELKEQIDRDVMRTHPDLHFFSGSDPAATRHRNEMKRALFIYAKLNPGLQYVQGMNELYAPLYYQFATHAAQQQQQQQPQQQAQQPQQQQQQEQQQPKQPQQPQQRQQQQVQQQGQGEGQGQQGMPPGDPPGGEAAGAAEADAFFCFCDLIAEFRDHYCQQLDNSAVGIQATLQRLDALLQRVDAELWNHLRTQKINPQFYGFRWLTLLLTQEFPFPDAVRLWDTLLSDAAGRMDCLLRLCTAMLLHVRQELLEGDFGQNLKLLQQYPSVDVQTILHTAANLSQTLKYGAP